MSSFKPLNLDSDVESEDEVDNTKEIQVEEALKLYQTALKYHAEGPPSFEKTAEAYRALFDSEVFKLNESLSEWKRHELYGDTLVFDSILDDEFDAGPVQLTGAVESAPNTLQQIIHLSYKNHGQFLLETMQKWIRERGLLPQQEVGVHVLAALQHFADALDKEDTDLDLWLRTASVAAMLGSQRITRFCLEAVLDGDDELIDSILRLPGLEEGFAGQQLRELVAKLEDSLSLMQAPLSNLRRKKLSETLKKRLNPYPFAPLPSEVAQIGTTNLDRVGERIILVPIKWDWAGVGDVLLRHFMAEQGGFIEPPPGAAITLDTAETIEEDSDVAYVTAEDDAMAGASPDRTIEVQHDEVPVASTVEADLARKEDQDLVMDDVDKEGETKNEAGGSATPQDTIPTQSRKRSTDSAGLPETAEGGRSRSKRIRARDVTTDASASADAAAIDLAKEREDKLSAYIHADKCLHEILNDIFERLGIEPAGDPQALRDLLENPTPGHSAPNDVDQATHDMYTALQSGSNKVASVLLSNETVDLGGMSREAGLNAFLGYAKSGTSQAAVKPILGGEGLKKFAFHINENWFSAKEVALSWVEALLAPGALPSRSDKGSKSSYMRHRWAEDLKRHLVQIIVNFDDYIYEELLERLAAMNASVLTKSLSKEHFSSQKDTLTKHDLSQIEMIETLFELHLDIFSLIKHPHSGVDAVTQTIQKDRLDRWAGLARDAMQLRSGCTRDPELDDLALRHIWASVFQMSVNDEIEPDYVIHSMEELKSLFQTSDGPAIELHNNAVMPELSVAAIDRELARISMKDFFLRVFDQNEKDPVAVIESLEPILEAATQVHGAVQLEDEQPDSEMQVILTEDGADNSSIRSPTQEMKRFLESASVSLRLSLWQRLREAYEAIEYPPKVLSCYLRSIETLVDEFKSPVYKDTAVSDRHVRVLSRLRIIDEVLNKVLLIIKNDSKTAFDCLSYEHLQTSMTALSEVLRILSAGNILEDSLRIGSHPVPRFESYPQGTFLTITARLHDMQLRAWMLQYSLLIEGISQNSVAFPTPSEDKFEFLRHVHYATGVRGFCHSSGRLFLRLARDEILAMDDVVDGNTRDTELAQVLYDLYGLRIFVQPADCHEFGSVSEALDRRVAAQLLAFVMNQAGKISIKDLPKTDMKTTIDKVHGALGRPKSNEDISLNRKVLTTYFKSPVNPLSLFNSLKGVGSLSTKNIPTGSAIAASKGWYFLMGNIALNKFRSQKRLTQGPTEDLNFAQAFFLQDLEYSVDRWETWYRLAQANDTQLEECVSWTADKMNNNSVELIHFQRAAIHCYVMATACAVRNADGAPQTIAKVADMYTDFGNRIYASSREPFSMNAFHLREMENKIYSRVNDQVVFQAPPFRLLTSYQAWKFASVLYKRAIQNKPDRWWNHYMLGKCLWKMHSSISIAAMEAVRTGKAPEIMNGPSWEQVVSAFVNAINTLPEKRERGREPIFEPHYKLASITHKLFQRKTIDHEKGEEILKNTCYSRNINGPENPDDWERFILAVLKALRTADKSSWHHRMIARAAHVIYDDSDDPMVAYGAKHELTQQMFTKTMTVQVWKPEYERPGRHFVYTSRYTRFFFKILDQTADKANFEALAKRVRRKTTDFFEHAKLWQDMCSQYLLFLRRSGKVELEFEDRVFKSINYDDFQVVAARLESWSQAPATTNPILDILRDVIELKRLNNGLMKAVPIDDLIGDTYALLYATIGPTLAPLPSEQPSELQPNQQPPVQTNASPFNISTLSQVQVDGTAEASSNPNPNLPFSIYNPSQLAAQQQQPAQVLSQTDTTARPRTKAIGRREIQRKAEAAAAKTSTPAPSVPQTTIPIRSPPLGTQPQLVIPSRDSPEKADTNDPSPTKENERLQVANSGTATAAPSVANGESAPPSVHDDADDESELSELDEDEVREIQEEANVHDPHVDHGVSSRPMFPFLSAKYKAEDTGTSAVGSPSENQETAEEKD
ncbi:hypothetical protein B0J11DRAFT_33445 [Dendryphion nanum]|uniref:Histone transcription regulator 3 homolog n=1 Tax=Dendryphion nanum TaxID=256645 RepID=A0A9P9ELB8_9PLEO|nr:hypothetical protein B0J11DRAFT_33445 [Dendryphion nanum]